MADKSALAFAREIIRDSWEGCDGGDIIQELALKHGLNQADESDVMVSDARREGFVFAKVAGQWTHTCQDCSRPTRSQRKLL